MKTYEDRVALASKYPNGIAGCSKLHNKVVHDVHHWIDVGGYWYGCPGYAIEDGGSVKPKKYIALGVEWESKAAYEKWLSEEQNAHPDIDVHAPEHYNQVQGTECIDVINGLNFGYLEGNAMKYLWRHKDKGNPKKDIQKCIFYLQRYVKTL